jgi:hypothetical protein
MLAGVLKSPSTPVTAGDEPDGTPRSSADFQCWPAGTGTVRADPGTLLRQCRGPTERSVSGTTALACPPISLICARCRRRRPAQLTAHNQAARRAVIGALRTVGNPDHGGADSGESYFYASPALGVNFRFCRRPRICFIMRV